MPAFPENALLAVRERVSAYLPGWGNYDLLPGTLLRVAVGTERVLYARAYPNGVATAAVIDGQDFDKLDVRDAEEPHS